MLDKTYPLVTIALALFACLFLTSPVHGSEDEQGMSSNIERDAVHDFHPNQFSLFLGVTRESSENGLSLGLKYERRLNSTFGFGVIAEYTAGDLAFWLYACALRLP